MKPAAIAGFVVLGVAAGAGAYLWSQQREPEPSVTAAPFDGAVAPAELVADLPTFRLADREGQLRSLQDWPGQALIVNFWATWCAPCRREIPLLQQLQRDHADEGFQVIGIAVDFRDKVLAYADEMQIDYPILIGEQDGLDAAASFGVEAVGFPFTVFSDRQGRIVTAHLGELHADQAALILDAVRRVDAGQLTPKQARSELEGSLARLQPAAEPEE